MNQLLFALPFVTRPFTLLSLLLASMPFALTAQEQTLFDQWTYDDFIKIELQTNLTQLEEGSRFENEYQDANFIYENAEGEEVLFDMKLRMRGKFRRKTCVFPPLKLNFDKDDLEAKGWHNDDEYKLVTPCVPGPLGREYVLREYLAYRVYQVLSGIHFRVQLVKFTIADTESNQKRRGWGFIIEDGKTIERRYNLERCSDCFALSADQFNQDNLAITALFQYLIGNSDWSVPMNKNLEILYNRADTSEYFAIPYDFDYSGFVNPTYAAPNPNYNLTSVRERVFLADLSDEEMQPAINQLLQKKQSILDMIHDFNRLNFEARQDLSAYLESCFTLLAEEGLVRPADKGRN